MSSVQSGHQPAASAGPHIACASCKYQRRRCDKDCVLAPYFPADNQKQFLNAHRLFGVANILKILNSVEPERRKYAMRSIIDQSNIRASDPVGGCYRIVVDLERRIKAAHNELEFLKTRIALYRAQMENMRTVGGPSHEANYHPAMTGPIFYPNMGIMQPHQQYYNYFLLGAPEGQGSELNGNMMANGVGLDMNINVPAASHGLDMEMLSLGQVVDAEEEAKPLDIFNMRPGFEVEGDSREITAESTITAFHYSSAKIEPNDEENHMENVLEHDLKGAASLFTLTNCNTR